MRVQNPTKEQPRGEYIKAVAKIVEALDPIYSQERERCLEAALLLLGNEDLANRLLNKQP